MTILFIYILGCILSYGRISAVLQADIDENKFSVEKDKKQLSKIRLEQTLYSWVSFIESCYYFFKYDKGKNEYFLMYDKFRPLSKKNQYRS